eukprot:SAG11_NODE_1370_length_5096_cov_2.366620_9_plen_76_part_00
MCRAQHQSYGLLGAEHARAVAAQEQQGQSRGGDAAAARWLKEEAGFVRHYELLKNVCYNNNCKHRHVMMLACLDT